MFATLSVGDGGKSPVFLQSNTDPQGHTPQHPACDACRDKKLKCSGPEDNCHRCQTRGKICTYLASKTSKKQKRRKQAQPASERAPTSLPPSIRTARQSPEEGLSDPPTATVWARDTARNKDKNKGYGAGSRADVANMLSTFDFAELSSPIPEPAHGELNASHMFDQRNTGPAAEGTSATPPLGFPSSDDMNLFTNMEVMSRLSPSHEELQTEWLHADSGTMPVEPFSQSNIDIDRFLEMSTPSRPESKNSSSMPLLDFTMTGVDDGSFPHESVSKLPTPPGSAFRETSAQVGTPEKTPCMHERRQTDLVRASPTREDSGSRSWAKESSRGNQPKALPSCHCVQKVLILYDEVETRRGGEKVSSTDYRLIYQKSVLSQCASLLGCTHCKSMSGFIMLLITICERLMSSFQLVSATCTDKLRHHQKLPPWQRHPISRITPQRRDSTEKVAGRESVHVGEYGIESLQEHYCLVITVIEFQIKEFRGLSMRLKDLAVSAGWESNVLLLRTIDDGLRVVLTDLRRSRNDTLEGDSSSSGPRSGQYAFS